MQIYVHKNNQQLGPFTEAESKAQLAAGTITLDDHVWWQGQANWLPLGQTSLVTPGAAPLPTVPAVPLPGNPAVMGTAPRTSQLAIWSLVCGCASLLCSLLTAIPAVILGHMSLSAINKTPGLQGRGLALAGTIIGYAYIAIVVGISIFMVALGNQVKDVFTTITSQIAQAQANSDESTTNTDQSTNAPEQSTPTATPTNSPDQSTNSDSSTNTPTATPTNQ